MANNLDEIIKNQKNIRFESPKHTLKDNFTEFERSDVNVRVGNNDYNADVLVGITSTGRKVFYDVINLTPIKIKGAESAYTATTKAAIDFTETAPSREKDKRSFYNC